MKQKPKQQISPFVIILAVIGSILFPMMLAMGLGVAMFLWGHDVLIKYDEDLISAIISLVFILGSVLLAAVIVAIKLRKNKQH